MREQLANEALRKLVEAMEADLEDIADFAEMEFFLPDLNSVTEDGGGKKILLPLLRDPKGFCNGQKNLVAFKDTNGESRKYFVSSLSLFNGI